MTPPHDEVKLFLTKEEVVALIKGETVVKDYSFGKIQIVGIQDPLTVYIAENYNRCDRSGFRIGIYLTEESAKRNTEGRDDSYDDEHLQI